MSKKKLLPVSRAENDVYLKISDLISKAYDGGADAKSLYETDEFKDVVFEYIGMIEGGDSYGYSRAAFESAVEKMAKSPKSFYTDVEREEKYADKHQLIDKEIKNYAQVAKNAIKLAKTVESGSKIFEVSEERVKYLQAQYPKNPVKQFTQFAREEFKGQYLAASSKMESFDKLSKPIIKKYFTDSRLKCTAFDEGGRGLGIESFETIIKNATRSFDREQIRIDRGKELQKNILSEVENASIDVSGLSGNKTFKNNKLKIFKKLLDEHPPFDKIDGYVLKEQIKDKFLVNSDNPQKNPLFPLSERELIKLVDQKRDNAKAELSEQKKSSEKIKALYSLHQKDEGKGLGFKSDMLREYMLLDKKDRPRFEQAANSMGYRDKPQKAINEALNTAKKIAPFVDSIERDDAKAKKVKYRSISRTFAAQYGQLHDADKMVLIKAFSPPFEAENKAQLKRFKEIGGLLARTFFAKEDRGYKQPKKNKSFFSKKEKQLVGEIMPLIAQSQPNSERYKAELEKTYNKLEYGEQKLFLEIIKNLQQKEGYKTNFVSKISGVNAQQVTNFLTASVEVLPKLQQEKEQTKQTIRQELFKPLIKKYKENGGSSNYKTLEKKVKKYSEKKVHFAEELLEELPYKDRAALNKIKSDLQEDTGINNNNHQDLLNILGADAGKGRGGRD